MLLKYQIKNKQIFNICQNKKKKKKKNQYKKKNLKENEMIH